MDTEKDLLKKDLAALENPEDIKKLAEDAEIMGHEDVAILAKEKLASLQTKVNQIEHTSPAQVAGIENLGGDPADLTEKTKEVDVKIEEVKAEAVKQIEEIQTQNLPQEVEKGLSNKEREKKMYEDHINIFENQLTTLVKWQEFFARNPVGNELVSNSPTSGRINFIERTKKLKTLLSEYIPLMQKYRNPDLRDEARKDTRYQGLNTEIYNQRVQFEGQHDPSIETSWNSTSEGRISYADIHVNNLPLMGSKEPIQLSELIKLSIKDKNELIDINKKHIKEIEEKQ